MRLINQAGGVINGKCNVEYHNILPDVKCLPIRSVISAIAGITNQLGRISTCIIRASISPKFLSLINLARRKFEKQEL